MVVAQASNPRTWEAEARGSELETSLVYRVTSRIHKETLSQTCLPPHHICKLWNSQQLSNLPQDTQSRGRGGYTEMSYCCSMLLPDVMLHESTTQLPFPYKL